MFDMDFHEIHMSPVQHRAPVDLEVNAHELQLLQDNQDEEELERTDGGQVEDLNEISAPRPPVVLESLFSYEDSDDSQTEA